MNGEVVSIREFIEPLTRKRTTRTPFSSRTRMPTYSELLDALETIKRFCEAQVKCTDCPMLNKNKDCTLKHSDKVPETWYIKAKVEL